MNIRCFYSIWLWINTYENTIYIYSGMNIHVNPAILMWTEGVLLVLTHCHIWTCVFDTSKQREDGDFGGDLYWKHAGDQQGLENRHTMGRFGASKWGQSEIRWPYPNAAPWNLVQSDLSPLFWLWCGEVATLRTHTSTTTSSVTSSSTTSTSSLAVLSKGAWTTGTRGNVRMQGRTKQQMPFTKWLVTAVIPEL